jgi:N-methylhydantoinase B
MSEHDTPRTDESSGVQQQLFEERELDPVTLQVIGGEFDTIADEMGHKMVRSSYSSIIRESEDLGAGLFLKNGDEIAESDYTPMHVGSLPGYIRGFYECLEERGDDPEEVINEGDVFWHNHPYYGASHSPDIAMLVPIFIDDEHVAWSAATAHILDIGTAVPGLTVDLHDMYGEGQLFKARKTISEGERITEVWNHFFENSRTPRMNEGDLQAMISAAKIGERRFHDLVDERGLATVLQAGKDLMDYADQLLRSKLRDLPDGEWHETAYLDDDKHNRSWLDEGLSEEEREERWKDERLKVDLKLRIEGDEITVDLTDSNNQVPTAFNVPNWGACKVAVFFTVRAILMDTYIHDEYIPQNSGTFRPINVETREGSIFEPVQPAAAFARISQVDMVGDLIVKALRHVAPERVMAGNAASVFFTSYSGEDPDHPGNYWTYLEVNDCSYGGRPDKDGVDCVGALIHNTRNRPTEDVELSHPLRVERYEMRDGPGHGAGEYRGGHGVVRETTMLAPIVQTVEGDGGNHTPWGAFGGEDGTGASLWHLRSDDDGNDASWYSRRNKPPSEVDVSGDVEVEQLYTGYDGHEYAAGDRHICISPMSGGYGDPYDRPSERVYSDWRNDMITREIARRDYGVVITEDGELDEEATADLRSDAE